jgi:pteridine reductase
MIDHSFPLKGKTILITGAARRLGKHLAITAAQAGANIVIHHGHSNLEAEVTRTEVESFGVNAAIIKCDLNDPTQVNELVPKANEFGQLFALVNNAAIFAPLKFLETSLSNWQDHLNTNLTAPFLLSQSFAKALPANENGRIINILDWRALRPGKDHFPYTISKAGLATLTRALALSLAPRITVNGIALGAVIPPSDGGSEEKIIQAVPANRWATLDELSELFLFLLIGPLYITGEIIHLDGGRHLV